MFSKLKTYLVLKFIGLANKVKSKSEVARGNRLSALKLEQNLVIVKATKDTQNLDSLRKAFNETFDEMQAKTIKKSGAKYDELGFAAMELEAK